MESDTITRTEVKPERAKSDFAERVFGWLSRHFVPPGLQREPFEETRQRELVLVGVLFVSLASGVVLALALTTLALVTRAPLHLVAMGIAIVTVIGYIIAMWTFRRRQNLLQAANIYGVTSVFSTIAPCIITGGVSDSPYLPLVLVVPVFLFLIVGRQQGMFWCLIAVVGVVAMLVLESFGAQFPQVIPEANMAVSRVIIWLMTLLILLLALLSYEGDFENLTARILAERGEFAHLAMHDPLTGLSNRKMMFTRAQEAVEYAVEFDHKAVIIFVDLDDFKRINDGYGHETGDEILIQAAERLRTSVRSMDTVARLGGDEFAVVLYGVDSLSVAQVMVDKLHKVLAEPYEIAGNSLSVSGSVGVAVAPDDGRDVRALLRHADKAMYRAKEFRVHVLSAQV